MRREKNMYVQICAIDEGQLVEREKEREKKSTCCTLMVWHFSFDTYVESVEMMRIK